MVSRTALLLGDLGAMFVGLTDRRLHPELPIFALADSRHCAVYIPGHVLPIAPAVAEELASRWQSAAAPSPRREVADLAVQLESLGRRTWETWCRLRDRAFRPECLNLQLAYRCDLACPYCFAAATETAARQAPPVCSDAVLIAAAESVAKCCAQLAKPFDFVVAGLGEPTLVWASLCHSVKLVREVADRHHLDWRAHLTTNGQFSEPQADWLSRQFPRVALSCDGAPEVHDRQRPHPGGVASSQRLENAAKLLLQRGVDIEVRATVLPSSLWHMSDLLEYAADRLGVCRVRVEPMFGDAGGWTPSTARAFVHEFLIAERLAQLRGIDLRTGSPRLDELHGPLCEAGRDSLRLLPSGTATNCFLRPAALPTAELVSRVQESSGMGSLFDQEAWRRARAFAFEIPLRCRDCFNQLHCWRTCPEACPWTAPPDQASFRCPMQKELARQWIWRAVQSRQHSPALDRAKEIRTGNGDSSLAPYLAALPEAVDRAAIEGEFARAIRRYRPADREMPRPAWDRQGFDVRGSSAWERLRRYAAQREDAPLSVYVHVPFCRQRCGFCDCHSFPVRAAQERTYVARVIKDLTLWAEQTAVASRPVTTIHFGGGTPNALSDGQLEDLLAACRQLLRLTPQTELAIETTASLCEDTELARLRRLGFTRLHVGVQTLEPQLRTQLGRRTPAAEVLARLRHAMEAGFVTSVDLLYGLPSQDAGVLLKTLDLVIAARIDGLSLYRINCSTKNAAYFRRHSGFLRDPLRDCVMLQCAEQRLTHHGYFKNHFAHYALARDKNLYFRHAFRGEDLLGLGASASGSFSGADYRCSLLEPYLEHGGETTIAFEGTTSARARAGGLSAAEAMLMCSELKPTRFAEIACDGLLDTWHRCALVRQAESADSFALTAMGSWLLEQMLTELRLCVDS